MKKMTLLLVLLIAGVSFTGCKTHYKVSLSDVVKAANSTSKSSAESCKKIVNASWKGDYETVKSLLQKGVSPNCVYYGKSALLAAARYGRSWRWDQNIDTVKILVEHGADIHYKYDNKGETITPTYIAAFAGHTKTATYLVSKGGSLKEAEEGHRKYVAREKGSLAALGLMAQAANSFRKSLASSSTGAIYTPINNSDTSSSSTSEKSSSSTSNVSTRHRGVSGIRSNGSISGVPSYQVRCKQGSSYIVYKKNGTWYRGDIGHMGNRYDSWSTDQVANYVCE